MPTWRLLGIQHGPKLRQVGSKLGPDGPKITCQTDFVAHRQRLRHRLDHSVDFLGVFNDFRQPGILKNVLPWWRRKHFKVLWVVKFNNDFLMDFGCHDGVKNLVENQTKLDQVVPRLAQLGIKLSQICVPHASLDVLVHKMWFPCVVGSQPVPTRRQHGPKTIPTCRPEGGSELQCFVFIYFCGPLEAKRAHERANRLG